jgi:hypothetical protein
VTALPPSQDIPSAWHGSALSATPGQWTLNLTPEHIGELEAALQQAPPLPLIDRETFPLLTLAGVLESLRTELLTGRGFSLIRGLDLERYDDEQAAALFFGLGSHLGSARRQNAAGDILGHVRDVGAKGSDSSKRIYQTSERQTFHTDSCDVVGLLCLREAKAGGDSLLVSAAGIYNAFLERRPDLLPCLFDPIATDRRGEVPDGMKPYFEIPVFTWHAGLLNIMYQRQYIESAQRFPDAMRLSDDHLAALDLFDELANDADLSLSMRLEPGDMQFVHNHSLLHDRTGFEDWPEPSRRRHLLRLWLSLPGDRPLPDCFAERFGSIRIGDRGGIVAPS